MNAEQFKDLLRTRREQECFPVINRGKLWYECLTSEQLSELRTWYNSWLDVTQTLVAPALPEWINQKLSTEEILL